MATETPTLGRKSSRARDSANGLLNGRYEVGRAIGSGGMATVYLARDLRLDRDVAIKQLTRELDTDANVARFTREIQVTAHLQHPNLMPLFDRGDADGVPFYVMPYVAGDTLRTRLRREKQLPVDEAIRLAVAIAGALDHAHRHGVIHRDLKPENILLDDGQPLVCDFGIAISSAFDSHIPLTRSGTSVGTPQYMSPEQAVGDVVDHRTDIYSLGALTYEMLAGEPPHVAPTAQGIIARTIAEEPRSLTVLRRRIPPHVDQAVRKALEKLPADRFTTTREFASALLGAQVNVAGPRRGASAWTQLLQRFAAGLLPAAIGLVHRRVS